MPALAALEQLQRLVPRQRVGEEEPQQRLVAQLDRHRVAVEPLDERLTAGRGQLVDPAAAAAARLVLALDQALALEPPQLRVDLAVAGGPEEARRAVDRPS